MRRILTRGGVEGVETALAFAAGASASGPLLPTRNVLPPLGVMSGGTDIPVLARAPLETT
jgi:hypothetical protein